jgi:hypothetical protein
MNKKTATPIVQGLYFAYSLLFPAVILKKAAEFLWTVLKSAKTKPPFLPVSRTFNYQYVMTGSIRPDGTLFLRILNKGNIIWNSEFLQLAAYGNDEAGKRKIIFTRHLFRDVKPLDDILFCLPVDSLSPEGIFKEVYFDIFMENEFYFSEKGNIPLAIDMKRIVISKNGSTSARHENYCRIPVYNHV